MKTRLIVCLLAAAFAAELSAADSAEPLRLGATLPLSGPSATYGRLIRDGIELAKSDLAEQGRPVEIFYQDTPLPDARAMSAIHALVGRSRIDALVGNFFNPVMRMIAPVIGRSRILAFHTAAADDEILAAGEYVLSTNTSIRDEAEHLAEYAYQAIGARRAAVLSVSNNFGESYAVHFSRRFSELGGVVIYRDTSPLGEPDLRSLVLRAKAAGPDVLMAGHFGEGLGLIMRAARELDFGRVILGPYESEDPSVLEVAGRISDNQLRYFVGGGGPAAAALDFKKRFEKRFGYPARILAANAYDATRLAAEALTVCGRVEHCAVRHLMGLREYPGASGVFSMRPDRSAKKEFVLKTIREGEFAPME
jgi:branched-chain amino acid transport system substrate-binding protein